MKVIKVNEIGIGFQAEDTRKIREWYKGIPNPEEMENLEEYKRVRRDMEEKVDYLYEHVRYLKKDELDKVYELVKGIMGK